MDFFCTSVALEIILYHSERQLKKQINPKIKKRSTGIEPAYQPWEGRILPLNYNRGTDTILPKSQITSTWNQSFVKIIE